MADAINRVGKYRAEVVKTVPRWWLGIALLGVAFFAGRSSVQSEIVHTIPPENLRRIQQLTANLRQETGNGAPFNDKTTTNSEYVVFKVFKKWVDYPERDQMADSDGLSLFMDSTLHERLFGKSD